MFPSSGAVYFNLAHTLVAVHVIAKVIPHKLLFILVEGSFPLADSEERGHKSTTVSDSEERGQ